MRELLSSDERAVQIDVIQFFDALSEFEQTSLRGKIVCQRQSTAEGRICISLQMFAEGFAVLLNAFKECFPLHLRLLSDSEYAVILISNAESIPQRELARIARIFTDGGIHTSVEGEYLVLRARLQRLRTLSVYEGTAQDLAKAIGLYIVACL